jgi:hypothetical protein
MIVLPRVFVVVPRVVCGDWWPRPWSELVAAAESGVGGLSMAVNPVKKIPNLTSPEPGATKDVDDYPYVVRGHMVFRQGQANWDGPARTETAFLHTQGW